VTLKIDESIDEKFSSFFSHFSSSEIQILEQYEYRAMMNISEASTALIRSSPLGVVICMTVTE